MAGVGGSRSFIEAARRRQIVDAAVEVLAETGYAGTTFARIAERAGISPSLISYHFGGKAELLRDVAEHLEEAIGSALTEEIGEPVSYREALRRLIEAQVRYFAGNHVGVRALGRLYREASDGEVTETLQRSRDRSLGDLEQMFAEGQAEGEFRRFATRPVAVALFAALSSVPDEIHRDPGTDIEAYATTLAELFDAAVKA